MKSGSLLLTAQRKHKTLKIHSEHCEKASVATEPRAILITANMEKDIYSV